MPLISLTIAIFLSGASSLLPSAAHAQGAKSQGGNVHCAILPRSDWLSWLEVEGRLKARGLRLVRLRISDEQCLSVMAIDGRGEHLALLMHPVSGEVLREKAQADPSNSRIVPWKIRKEP